MTATIKRASDQISGTITAPPSKSMAHRAVLCAALAQVYGSRRWAVAALWLGVAATVFYAATPGVIAALWVLPRLWFDAPRGWRAQTSSL